MTDTPQAPSRESREAAAALFRERHANLPSFVVEKASADIADGRADDWVDLRHFAAFERAILARPSAAGAAVSELRENVLYILDNEPLAVRVYEGDGPDENIAASLAATWLKLESAASPAPPPPPPSDDLRAENER